MDKNKRLTPICIIYVDGERLGPAWEGRFRSIRVVDRLSGISGCAIVFSGGNSGKMDTEIFSVGSTISVYMGYKDDMRETFNGEVATFTATLPEAGEASKFIVTAASYLGQLDRNGQSRVFENVSPSQIMQKILSEYGLQADCESFGPVKERLKEEGMSDWKFILELARRYGRGIYCFGKNVYVKAQMTMHKDDHIYEWGKSLIGLDVTMGDIGKATGVQVISHDQITGEDFVGECKLKSVKLKIGGTNDWRSVYVGVVRQSIRTVIDPSVIDRTEAEEVAEALMREMSFDFIKGNGEAEGDAGLKAGAVVTIKYAGIRYDGEYIAEEVEHKLSMKGGYTTEFDIRRNMIGDEAVEALGGSRAVGPSHAPPPREKPESEQITVYEDEEEEHGPLLKEILSVACYDKDGNETTKCFEGQPLTIEARCNASVEEGAPVTFNIYCEGDEPGQDRLIETLTGVVRRGLAVARWVFRPGFVGINLLGEKIKFFVTVVSRGCEEVQSGRVEAAASTRIYVSPSSQRGNRGVGNYGTEADRMQGLSDLLVPILTARGHTVLGGSNALSLTARIAESNANNVDIHVALHSNAGGGTGPETWHRTGSASGESLARAIQTQLEVLFGSGRGVKHTTEWQELNDTDAVVVLIEVAFHDNPNDVAWMLNNWNAIAGAIADGIDNYIR